MMTSKKNLLALLAFSSSIVSVAAYAASVQATASANVVPALSVAQTTPLSFGSFSAGGTGGTIKTDGMTTGDVLYANSATPGTFTITGAPSTTINSVSGEGVSAPITLSANGGADSMNATLAYPESGAVATDESGTVQFNVTGILNVAANQAPGNYTGTYNVQVNY